MGVRPDLDLSGILANFDRRWLSPDVEEKVADVPERDGLKFPNPTRFGRGPDVWSACTDVAVRVKLCWDVNGYYAALGVSPQATRRQLREAYQALDGQNSPYLTYAFKQLLNPETRDAYDASPLGQPFLDAYTQLAMKRRAKAEAHRRSAVGEFITAEEVIDEWGYALRDEEEGVDTVSPAGQDLPRKADRLEYSYYGWKTAKFLMDEGPLQQWQGLLSTAATQLGIAPKLSFGITGMSDHPYILEQVGDRVVIFFPEGEEPTEAVACKAIDDLTRFSLVP